MSLSDELTQHQRRHHRTRASMMITVLTVLVTLIAATIVYNWKDISWQRGYEDGLLKCEPPGKDSRPYRDGWHTGRAERSRMRTEHRV